MRPSAGVERAAIRLSLRIDAGERALSSLSLNVRLQIRAERRRYSELEAASLWELFGPVAEWGRSLRPVPWARLRHRVGPFTRATTTRLDVPGEFEFGAAAPKYLAALRDGAVPAEALFSGTLSWPGSQGRPRTAMIPWDREASFEVPPRAWRRVLSGTR